MAQQAIGWPKQENGQKIDNWRANCVPIQRQIDATTKEELSSRAASRANSTTNSIEKPPQAQIEMFEINRQDVNAIIIKLANGLAEISTVLSACSHSLILFGRSVSISGRQSERLNWAGCVRACVCVC